MARAASRRVSLETVDGIPEWPVHPAAAVFPMLDEEELTALAVDIGINGLRHPIVLDPAGEVLVDGRNRLEACRAAGVEPQYWCLPEGSDIAAYIVSVNLARRHMTAGQRAMALAMVFPEPDKGGRGHKASRDGTVSKQRLSLARKLLDLSRDHAERVLAGTVTLDAAYREAAEGADEGERDRQREREALARLRRLYPKWAEAVDEGRLGLLDACREAEAEADRLKQHRWAVTRNLDDALTMLLRQPADAVNTTVAAYDRTYTEQTNGEPATAERLREAAAFLVALADAWEEPA